MKWLKRIFALRNVASTAMVILVLVYFPMFFEMDFLDPVQNTLEDLQITDIVFSQIFDYSGVDMDTNIVLVNIGHLSRLEIAGQINILNQYKPKVIGLAVHFKELKNQYHDSILSAELSKVENLVLSSKILKFNRNTKKFSSFETSHHFFSQNFETGFLNIIEDRNSYRTIRNFSVSEMVGKDLHYSFPVTITKIYDEASFDNLILRGNNEEIINYRRNGNKYKIIDALELFRENYNLAFVKDKIVILGYLGPELGIITEKSFFTPMNEKYVGKSYPDMYSPIILANIISMILEKKYIDRTPEWLGISLTIVIVHVYMMFFSFVRDKKPAWYESLSIITTISGLVFFLILIIILFSIFNYELKLQGIFFAILIVKQIYELYNDSIMKIGKGVFVKKLRILT